MTLFSNLLLYLAILLPMAYVLYLVATSPVVRAVFFRNVMSYFSGILGYLFIVVFVVVAAILAFNAQFFTANLANLDQLTKSYPLLLLFIVPAITMTVWAEERKQGTDELLFTLPGNDVEILIGKYLAVVAVYTVALIFSTGLWAVLAFYSDPGFRMFLSTYLGYWFAGASLLAVGMFASSLTRSPTVAFVLGGILCAVPVFLSASALGGSSGFLRESLGENETLAQWFESLTAFSIGEHLHEFSLGVVRLSSVLYFESLAIVFLYLNLIVISERHWSRRQKWQMGLQYAVRAVSVVAVLISLYVVVTQSSGRADIDLTPQKYFTLSDATNEVLDQVEAERPVTIHAFLSPDVPTEYVRTKRDLEGLLRQIDQRGGSRVEVRVVDTAKYQPSADEAEAYGIEPRQVQGEVDGKFVTEDVYLGLVISSSYDEVVVPFVGLGTPVEYEITRSLRTVSNAHRLTVGILDTEAHVMTNAQTQEIIKELKKHYNVESVSADNAIESEKQLFPIEEADFKALEENEENQVPDSLRELFEKKKHPLSAELNLAFDKKAETWTLEDLESKRRYKIHKVPEEKKAEDAADEAKPPESQPEEEKAEEKAEGKPAPKYAVFVQRFDALVAVLPSTLSVSQMPHFVEYVEKGGPTLIFDDPLPVTLQSPHGPPTLAPRLNIAPSPSPHGGGGGEPRADGGRATSLLKVLNLDWDNGEIAWDLYNPFPEFDDAEGWRKGVFTVVGVREDAKDAVNQESAITEGLGKFILLYTGQIAEATRDKMEFTPLLRSGKTLSGEFSWDELVRTSNYQNQEFFDVLPVEDTLPPIDMEGLSDKEKADKLKGTRFIADDKSHIFAAQIRGKAENPVNAIYVADADMIGDQFFHLRWERYMNLDLDNVSFVLNAIDALAGDSTFLELRRRKPPQPSLTEIEKEKEDLRAARQAAVNKSRESIIEKQTELRKVLVDVTKEISKYEDEQGFVDIEKIRDATMTLNAEKQRLAKEQEKLEDQLNRVMEKAKVDYERGVKETENEIRRWAIILPSLPAISMGLIFLSVLLINERREIAPDRRR